MILKNSEVQEEETPDMQIVRHAIKENDLLKPLLVTDEDYNTYILKRGKGWGYKKDNKMVGFAIADLQDNNIRALFVLLEFEKMGIGKRLHQLMPDWYFTYPKEKVSLSTSPGTRAESFYTKQGWTTVGYRKSGEIKMEMTATERLNKIND